VNKVLAFLAVELGFMMDVFLNVKRPFIKIK
jgi:hypothetical protein